jgi:arylsulfatase A-like enzyme
VLGLALWTTVLGACADPAGDAPGARAGSPAASTTARAAEAASASASGTAAGAASSAAAPSQPKARNVILMFVDAMRADMPWQGYDRPIAPNLTKLAAESVVYPRAYSVSSYTAKVMGAALSGRYPSTLYRGATFFTKYSKANVFFPELLQAAGIRTMAVHAHGYFDRDANLNQGMDVWKVIPGLKWNAETDENVTGPKMNELAMELLGNESNTRKPFFFWLHYMDPHDKYVVHEGVPRFGRTARDFYDGEIYFTDQRIGELLDFCRKQPWWENTVVIISGDHGEAFGEHNQWKHAFALWEVLTRVPVMVHGAGVKPRRIDARRSHIDLAPTILELAGLPPHEGFVGKSLVPELYGAPPENREPILLDLPADTYNPPTRAIVYGDFKLLEDPGPKYKLFDLKADPGELRNLADVAQHAATLAETKKRFDEAWSKHSYVAPYGGEKLVAGRKADGPKGPAGWADPDDKDAGP